MGQISVDGEKCVLCGACVETCPDHIFLREGSEVRTQREDRCISCGHCVAVCPVDAVIHQRLRLEDFAPLREGLRTPPEDLYQFLRSRRSCRAYDSRPVPREALEKLIEIGRLAPTGHNRENVEFIVIQDKARVEKLSRMAGEFYGAFSKALESSKGSVSQFVRDMLPEFRLNYEFFLRGEDRIFRGAPVVILMHTSTDSASSLDNCLYALFHIVLMAHSMGLGTCINRIFVSAAEKAPEIGRDLNIPEGHRIQACVTVGYPRHKYLKLPGRKPAKVRWI